MCASFLTFAEVWMRQMSQGVCEELKCKEFWDSFHAVVYSCWYAGQIRLTCPNRLKAFPEQRLTYLVPEMQSTFGSPSERYRNVALKNKQAKHPKSCRFPPSPSQGQIFNLLDVQSHVQQLW